MSVVHIEDESPSGTDLIDGKSPWFSKLSQAAKSTCHRNKPVYLIATSIPVEGIEYFVQEIRQQPYMQNVHFIFNLDKSKEDFTTIFQKNLIVSILKNGKLSTCIRHFTKFINSTNHENSNDKANQRSLIQYVSLNLSDETIDPSIEKYTFKNVDYSGVDSSGKEVMGLAQIQDDSPDLMIDPIFKWEFPENCALSSAATIPHAYLSVSIFLKF